MVRLSGLDSDSMTDDQRDAFVNMAENLGLDLEEAENIIDAYLDETDNDGDSEAGANGFSRVEVVGENSAEASQQQRGGGSGGDPRNPGASAVH